jgi:hypothetical protein
MILFVTTREHEYTVRALVQRNYRAELPMVRVTNYEQLFQAQLTLSATHIFTDLERLDPWEVVLAAACHRVLGEAGIRRLNDPARVKTRYALLRALHRAGFNPFDAYRADDAPRPKRFPVFLRHESDHGYPLSPLIDTQEHLDQFIEDMPAKGMPLQGVIVVEYCAEPIRFEVWKKWGTYCVGGEMHVDHSLVSDSWNAKNGNPKLADEQKFLDEKNAIETNRYADAIRPAFAIGGIEFGRADHSTVGGRQVVYEINTNPAIGRRREELSPIREQAFAVAHQRMARLLWAIDSGDGSELPLPDNAALADYRAKKSMLWRPPRP